MTKLILKEFRTSVENAEHYMFGSQTRITAKENADYIFLKTNAKRQAASIIKKTVLNDALYAEKHITKEYQPQNTNS